MGLNPEEDAVKIARRADSPQSAFAIQHSPIRPPNRPQINFLQLAFRNLLLILLCLGIGLAAGYFQYSRTPAIYRSSARVQIVEPTAHNLPVKGLETRSIRSIGDEMLVIGSESILKRAAELGQLASSPEFLNWPAERIGAAIADGLVITAPHINKMSSQSVVEVHYSSTNPDTSLTVVQAVVDAYGMHLQEQYQNVGQETLGLIQTARDDLLQKLTKLEGEFSAFKQESDLIFREGDAISGHRDNADQHRQQMGVLLRRKSGLISRIESARLAIKEKRSPEAILLLLEGSESLEGNSPTEIVQKQPDQEVRELRETRSDQMRLAQLVPLQLERDQLLNNFASSHPQVKAIEQRIGSIESMIAEVVEKERLIEQRIGALKPDPGVTETPEEILQRQIDLRLLAAEQQLDALEYEEKFVADAYANEIDKAKAESNAVAKSAEYFRQIGRQQKLYDSVVQRLDEVSLISNDSGFKLSLLDSPKRGHQIEPSLARSLLMGGFLGCILAGGLALLREWSDGSYSSVADITGHVGLAVIGQVPQLSGKRRKLAAGEVDPYQNLDARLCTLYSGKGAEAEAFRSIRTTINVTSQDGWNRILQVTSSTPGDGKSTIAANVAIAMAQSGRSVLLLDADLRRPRVHILLGMECDKGVVWAVEQVANSRDIEELDITEVIHETLVANLSVMLAGDTPDNPSELLASDAFPRLLEMLRPKFDIIIIDTPPMLAVSDPANVVRYADGVLMVIRLTKNSKPLVAKAARLLESLHANVLGVVVNGVGSREAKGFGNEGYGYGYYRRGAGYSYGYGYGYGYGDKKVRDGLTGYYNDESSKSGKKEKPKQESEQATS